MNSNVTFLFAAGEIRLLYSSTLVDRASEASGSGPISLHDVVSVLEHTMTVAECAVFTYLSNEGDLVVLIKPRLKYPSHVQVFTGYMCNVLL